MRALASHRGGKTLSISPSQPARWGSPTTLPRINTTGCSNCYAREGKIPATLKSNGDEALAYCDKKMNGKKMDHSKIADRSADQCFSQKTHR